MSSFFSWLFGGEPKSPQYHAAAKLFTPRDLAAVEELFIKFAGSKAARLGQAAFCDVFGLDPTRPLSAALFEAAATGQGEAASGGGKPAAGGGVSLEDVIVLLAAARGSEAERADLCHRVVGRVGGGGASRQAVARAVAECAAGACGLAAEKQLADGFAETLVESLPPGGGAWGDGGAALRSAPLAALREAVCGMVAGVAPAEAPITRPPGPAEALPALALPEGVELMGCLLRPEWAWLLAAGLPREMRSEWRLGFSSRLHGASFSTFMGRVGGQGPSLVLIRDKGGGVMGGLAEAPWAKTPSYYGGFRTRVFSLWPRVAVYGPSGVNEHFQWCGVGFTSMPNGFGFGGQQGHFAAFVDASFDRGMSRPAATFASPSLLASPVFDVDTVECWLIGPREEDEAGAAAKAAPGASVLDRFKEDRMVVTLGGAASDHSAGYRD